MDPVTAQRLATDARLGHVCRGLSSFGLGALALGCRRGRIPMVVASSLDDGQLELIGGLMTHPEGRAQIQQAIDAAVDLRTWGTLH